MFFFFFFHGEELLASRPTFTMEDCPLSVVRGTIYWQLSCSASNLYWCCQ